jgi:hypothetical protein
MAIRAQCDNCGKVYNLPDESAGKRLRCKQCAVAFTVPSATGGLSASADRASTGSKLPVAQTTAGPQKICVVCQQNVAGRPRTKDKAGNYYCQACYEEKARSREQLASSRVGAPVPAGVGGGDESGGDDGGVVDLAALEPTEQFDESTQPPPPPIPDYDPVAPPPVLMEIPKPKKKKKPVATGKTGKSARAAKSSGDSFASKLLAFPIELWIIGIAVILAVIGTASSSASGFAFMGLVVIGVGCMLWGQICIAMAAFAESTMTGILYLFVPVYWLIFLLGNWADLQRHVLRVVLGVAMMIGGGIVMARHGDNGDGDEDERPRVSSRSRATAGNDASAEDDETTAGETTTTTTTPTPGNQSPAATGQTPAKNPAAAAAEAPAEEAIRFGISFKQMLSDGKAVDFFFGDPEVIQKRKEDIEDTILTSFEKRGIKPAPGQYYSIECVVEESLSSVQKIKMANGDELPAPILACRMRIRDSVGRGNYVYGESRNIELSADAIAKASKSKFRTFREVGPIKETL